MILPKQVTCDSKPKVFGSGKSCKKKFVVLGGGIAGLATARELLHRGCQVILIEKSGEVGGLARTFSQDGFRFDIGGHRFHSNNPTVVQWLKDLLKSDLLVVPRTSHIYLNGQFVDYPIQLPNALSIFSPLQAAQMVFSYFAARLTQRHRPDYSFEDWVIKRYGQALYEVFFRPYTEKVWGISCQQLSATWAAQRISVPNFWKMLQHAIRPPKERPKTSISQFYYPRQGFGMIPEALKTEILHLGGIIHTATNLTSLVPLKEGFKLSLQHKDGQSQIIQADQVISSIPIEALLKIIPPECGSEEVLKNFDLEYRDMICLFLALKKQQVSQDSWTYFPLKDLPFGRTHEPKNWSGELVPNDSCTSLAIEIFSGRDEQLWNLPDQAITDLVVEKMSTIGWVHKPEVIKSWVLRVPYAYPVYRIGYQENLMAVKQYLNQWQNLHLVGRTGSFRYLNSDGVIEDVFRLMHELFDEAQSTVQPLATQIGRWM